MALTNSVKATAAFCAAKRPDFSPQKQELQKNFEENYKKIYKPIDIVGKRVYYTTINPLER